MLIDANLLIYAADSSAPQHEAASGWLTEQLNGGRRVAIPWQSLAAFLRIATHPRASENPLAPSDAWSYVEDWLACDVVWAPEPGAGFKSILEQLLKDHHAAGNLVPDAMLAALAIEHGLTICSADSDFARYTEAAWLNPIA